MHTKKRYENIFIKNASFNGSTDLQTTAPSTQNSKLKSFYLTAIIFSAFSFSDVYFAGLGRPVDYLVLIAIILYQIFCNVSIKFSSLIPSVLLVGIMSPWLFVGALNGHFLGSAAILVGASLIIPFFQSNGLYQISTFNSALKFTILVNVIVLAIQMFLYYGQGYFLDFHSLIGSIESRGLNEELQYFRPSGLFQEPNAYCTVMFCLISLRVILGQTASAIDYLGMLSMILTQSLWGFGASIIVLWLLIGSISSILILTITAVGTYVLLQLMGISLNDLSENSVTLWRIMNINDDPSRQARYGSASSWQINEGFIFGHGVDTSNFQEVAANAIGFLVYSFGIVGVLLISIWAAIFQKVHYKSILIILFLFTTFPPFSYIYFWIFLSLILSGIKIVSGRPVDTF